jgi:hypothetical protein
MDRCVARAHDSSHAQSADLTFLAGLPSQLAQNPAYSALNVLEWIKLEKFNDYLVYKSENTVQNT